MARRTITAVTAVALALAAPAAAEAMPYLSAGEAARATGRALHAEYTNIARGSLDAVCPRTARPNFRRCYYTYYDLADQCWEGATAIRENFRSYSYRILWDGRCGQ